jgi:hypothetical protein
MPPLEDPAFAPLELPDDGVPDPPLEEKLAPLEPELPVEAAPPLEPVPLELVPGSDTGCELLSGAQSVHVPTNEVPSAEHWIQPR